MIVEDDDGVRYEMSFLIEAEVVRGPLGRFQDLADQIAAEGLTVPAPLLAVLAELHQPQTQE